MKTRYRRQPLAAATALFLMALATPVAAQSVWEGDVSDDWFDADNWQGGAVPPNGTDDVLINIEALQPVIARGATGGDAVVNGAVRLGNFSGPAASLMIRGGGTLTSGGGIIGSGQGTTSTVNVDGAGSKWTSMLLSVGAHGGNGVLNISDGAQVNADQTAIGSSDGERGEGVVTVSGPGSSLNLSANSLLIVGSGGKGSLYVLDGGAVHAFAAVVSTGEMSGAVKVQGPGSTWTVAQTLTIGQGRSGSVEVLEEGKLTSVSGTLGSQENGIGSILIDGEGSRWDNSGTIVVGQWGTGELTIANRGAVSNAGTTTIGDKEGSQGTVNIAGAGSEWESTASLEVGAKGVGILNIADGGKFTLLGAGGFGSIGKDAGSRGTVNVVGPASAWEIGGGLTVGDAGAGTLAIAQGGNVKTAVEGTVGAQAGSHGTVLVTGPDSLWDVGDSLYVGKQGAGELTVAAGGTVNSRFANIGGTGGSGSVTVTGAGSTLKSIGNMLIGAEGTGTGTLTIADGGRVNSGGRSAIGVDADSQGTVLVTGANSNWTTAGGLTVGEKGIGTLTIANGGTVSHEGNGSIGRDARSQGTVTVTGAGSTLNTRLGLIVGFEGTGTLAIADGATVNSNYGLIGSRGNSRGTATVGARSTWNTQQGVVVGAGTGIGTLTIAEGGKVSGQLGMIAEQEGSQGTVTVSGPDSRWTANGTLAIGNMGTGTLNIRDGGEVQADAVYVGQSVDGRGNPLDGPQGTGTLNIGSGAGEAAAVAGTLQASRLIFGAGTGVLNFNHTGNADGSALLFAADISGAGAVNQLGSGTTTLTGTNTYTGATQVTAGTLAVNGSIASSSLTTIAAGARLQGSGTVGKTTVQGTIAPGNSIGTLKVNGDYVQTAGSTYEVELDTTGAADRLDITGTAALNGTVAVNKVAGRYLPGTHYTILNAAGGVSGTYAALTQNLPFVNLALNYSANQVSLDVGRNAVAFCDVAASANQCATGRGAESLGSGGVYDAIVGLPDQASVQAAFDALSGEIHAGTRGALREQSSDLRNATAQRDTHKAGGFWTQGLGAWGHVRSDGNAARMETDRTGLLLGADWAIGEGGYVGVAGGYGKGSVKVDERRSSVDIDTLQTGLYGGVVAGRFGLDAGIGYARHNLDGQRDVAFAGFNDHLKADYDAQTLQAYLRGTVQVNEAVSGFIEAASVNVKTDGFREKGGAAALTVQDDSTKATYGTVGVRLDLPTQTGPKLHGSLGWRQRFGGDDQTQVTEQFQGGQPFTVLGAQTERKAFVGDVGLDWALGKNSQLSVSYAGTAGGGEADNRLDALFSMKF